MTGPGAGGAVVPGAIVQARMGSTRLPGKVLLRVQDDTLLGHVLRRLARCRTLRQVVVATTERPADDAVVAEAQAHGTRVFRGSEDDVLARYLGAAARFGVDPVVRITSDCPLADPQVIDRAVARFEELRASGEAVDVVTNTRPGARTYPRGLDVEVASAEALRAADARLAADAPEREHVTQHLYRRPDLHRIEDLLLPLDLTCLRWTVDTPADFELVREIYDALYPDEPDFGLHEVLALLGRRPELLALNAHVRQKET